MAIGFSLNDLIEYYERNNYDKDCEIRVAHILTQQFEPKYCYDASAEIKDFRIVPSTGGTTDNHQGKGKNFFAIIVSDDVSNEQAQDDINDQIENDCYHIGRLQQLKIEAERDVEELRDQIEKYDAKIKSYEMQNENKMINW